MGIDVCQGSSDAAFIMSFYYLQLQLPVQSTEVIKVNRSHTSCLLLLKGVPS